jgi:hypothetical protein
MGVGEDIWIQQLPDAQFNIGIGWRELRRQSADLRPASGLL